MSEKLDMEVAVEEIADGLGLGLDAGADVSGTDDLEASGQNTSDAANAGDLAEVSGDGEGGDPGESASTETPSASEASVDPPPKTWRPEAAKLWEQVPAEARTEILKREEDMFRGIEAYKQDAGLGKALRDMVMPHIRVFEQTGDNPMQVINNLLRSHVVLTNAPQEQKQTIFAKLAEMYGVGVEGTQPYVDPQIASMQKTIDDLRNRVDTQDQQTASEIRSKIRSEIDAFAADPANVYFNEVANDIASLIRTKAAATLQEAYELAIWRNPTTRAKEQARLAAEVAAQEKRKAEEKAEAARKATGANVRVSAKQGRGTAPVGSMDDTLKETFAAIQQRG